MEKQLVERENYKKKHKAKISRGGGLLRRPSSKSWIHLNWLAIQFLKEKIVVRGSSVRRLHRQNI